MTELVVPRSMPTATPLAAAGDAIQETRFRADHLLLDLSNEGADTILCLRTRVQVPCRVYMGMILANLPANPIFNNGAELLLCGIDAHAA